MGGTALTEFSKLKSNTPKAFPKAWGYFFVVAVSLLILPGCGGKDCESDEPGAPALRIINTSNCDLNVDAEDGPFTFVKAGAVVCETTFKNRPYGGKRDIRALKFPSGEVCDTQTIDFGEASETEPGPTKDFIPTACRCDPVP